MIVFPALGVLIQQVAQAAAIGALIGGLFGGGAEAVSGIREHGEINSEVAINVIHGARKGATGGALGGAGIAAVGVVLAPAIPAAGILAGVQAPVTVVDDVVIPLVGTLDDVAKSAVGSIDDAAAVASTAAIADDAANSFLSRVGRKVNSAASSVRSGLRLARNKLNARFFTRLSKGSGNNGYVYVMDDVATTQRYKIGKTARPVERLSEVQSKTGLKLEYTCIIGTDDMKLLERTLFEKFKFQRRPNTVEGTTEIFLLNSAQVAAACSH